MKRSRWEWRISCFYPPAQAELTIVLADVASKLAKRTSRGMTHGIPQHEVTLTQTALLDIARRAPNVTINAFTQNAEAENGADWEWWVRGGSHWFATRVQAKRLIDGNYAFGHLIGGDRARPQLDALLASADAAGLPAIYALYNPADRAGKFSVHGSAGCFPSRSEGVTVVPANYVKATIGVASAPRLHVRDVAVPWSCLAGCACWCPLDGLPEGIGDGTQLLDAFSDALQFDGPQTDPAFVAAWRQMLLRLMADLRQQATPEPFGPIETSLTTGWFSEPPERVLAAVESPGRELSEDLFPGDGPASSAPSFIVVQGQ